MSLCGIMASMTIEEAKDGDIFLAYVEHILCPALKPGDVVVMDNLSSHKIKGVQQLIEKAGKEALENAISEAIRMITPDNAKAWFNHCINGVQ